MDKFITHETSRYLGEDATYTGAVIIKTSS